MEDSHFNSSYFWSPVPTVQGQIENAMFLNKMKEQLGPDNKGSPSFPHSSHYPAAVLTMDAGGRVVPKQEGGGGGVQLNAVGGHLHQPHTSQNITVVPVQSTGIMTAAGLVITTPQGTLVSQPTSTQSFVPGPPANTMIVSALHPTNTESSQHSSLYFYSHNKKEDLVIPPVVMPTPGKRGRKKKSMMQRAGANLPPGSDALILAHLAAGGQHHTADHYDLSNDEDEHGNKDGTKSYRCRMCAVTFFSKSDMQIHAKSHTEAKPHKCPHCSKSFANSSYLSQHIRIHSGAKPYTCSFCQKTFRQLSHLQQHTRNHTEGKPHKCPHCSKSFANSSYLAQHIRIHSGAKPYTCSFCQKTFRQLSHLQQHHRSERTGWMYQEAIWWKLLSMKGHQEVSMDSLFDLGLDVSSFLSVPWRSTLGTDLTSASILAVRKPSLSCPTCSLTAGSTTKTSRTSATTATAVTQTRPVWRCTCPLTRSNTPSSTPVACATAPTPRRPT
ncbi:zinc finger protein 384 isoform X7 [Salmo trutta]|uniref:zinc finger protein 384 isoform X7 n=1 Tax=Salmo trutta TaxID=8032 RepID=UPI001130768D|nr:zinc finger protein 384-like isoform X7 [Salmo trutta]